MSAENEHRDPEWTFIRDKLRARLLDFGTEDVSRSADFWVDDDDWGHPQQKVYVRNLRLLTPALVGSVQQLMREHPGWETLIAVSVPGEGDAWPDMWLTVRADEVVGELNREILPQFRNAVFASRQPG